MADDGGLRPLFRQHLPTVDWQTIETGLVEGGVPDSDGCHPRAVPCPACGARGVEFWIEYKQTHAYAVKVKTEQVGWALRRLRAGGRAFFAVRRWTDVGPRRGPAVDELWLISGWAARELRATGLVGLPPDAILGRWGGGPARWDWPAVLAALVIP